MDLPPKPYIDLTGHLSSLKSSLTPDSKQFEPCPPLWHLTNRPATEPATWILRIGLVFLLTLAALAAAVLSH